MGSGILSSPMNRKTITLDAFDQGLGAQIFEDLAFDRNVLVTDNDLPIGVLLSPSAYTDLLEDAELLVEVLQREQCETEEGLISHSDLLKSLSITEEELERAETSEIE